MESEGATTIGSFGSIRQVYLLVVSYEIVLAWLWWPSLQIDRCNFGGEPLWQHSFHVFVARVQSLFPQFEKLSVISSVSMELLASNL